MLTAMCPAASNRRDEGFHHTGMKALFPAVREAIAKVIDPVPPGKIAGYQPMKWLATKAITSAKPNSNCNCPERAIARLCASASASPETSLT